MSRPGQFPFTPVVATIAVVATLILLAALFFWPDGPPDEAVPSSGAPEGAPAAEREEATLYFPATSGMLGVEARTPPAGLESEERRRWLAEQLLAGPEQAHLRPVFSTEAELASVVVTPEGTVLIDISLPESDGVGMGSTEEMLAIYSMVNTMLLDEPSTQRAVLLINGRQRETLAGHLDTSRPLYARPDLVRDAG